MKNESLSWFLITSFSKHFIAGINKVLDLMIEEEIVIY